MLTRRGLLGGTLAAALLPHALKAAPLDRVKAKGTLRVSVYQDFAPWSWRQDGRLTGIDIDLATALAGALGVKTDFWDFPAGEDMGDDLRNTVWRGPLTGGQVADVMMHVPYDRAFQKANDRVAIVAPYYRESFAMACAAGKVDCELPPPQYKGRRLAAELDSVPDFYLMGSFGGVLRQDVRHFPSAKAALDEVAAGRADMAVATRAQVENAKSGAGDRLTVRKGPLPAMTSPGWDVGVAVRDDSRDLGDAIEAAMARLSADGSLKQIFGRFGVTHMPPLAG